MTINNSLNLVLNIFSVIELPILKTLSVAFCKVISKVISDNIFNSLFNKADSKFQKSPDNLV